jgi:threonine dehydrogenase-like Zn-dependent dehydrogenase
VRCAAPWGVVCFVGEGGQVTIDVSPEILRKQLVIMGSWTFSTVGQGECARFVADRGLAVDDLFTEHWSLHQAVDAYKLFDAQTSGKAVFDF